MVILKPFISVGITQRPCRPDIKDFSFIYSFIDWNLPICDGLQISHFQMSFADSNGEQLQMLLNFTNQTNTKFNVSLCVDICYFTVKAVLDDDSESHSSSCLKISDQLEETIGLQILLIALSVSYKLY